MSKYMGQIMAECDCQHAACAVRGYCMASRIEALEAERDHWRDIAGREGVCMSCSGPNGAPEPYGCTDCLNTGYCGEHHNVVADLENKLRKAMGALGDISDGEPEWPNEPEKELDWCRNRAKTALAELKGQDDE